MIYHPWQIYIYLFILFILSLLLTFIEQLLSTIKNSNKMLTDVSNLVRKPIYHKKFYKNKKVKNIKTKIF